MGLSCLITQQRVKTHINLGDDHEGDPHVLGVLSFLAAFLMVRDFDWILILIYILMIHDDKFSIGVGPCEKVSQNIDPFKNHFFCHQ